MQIILMGIGILQKCRGIIDENKEKVILMNNIPKAQDLSDIVEYKKVEEPLGE